MATIAATFQRIRSPAPRSGSAGWRLFGPGILVAVGYMDPGNWATDLDAGSRYGFALLSVVVCAGLAAAFLQLLAIRLTLATGTDLATLMRRRFSRPTTLFLWLVSEIAMVATDLAELLGAGLALKLLLGISIEAGMLASSVMTFALLAAPRRLGGLPERVITALVIVVAGSFAVQIGIARPDGAEVLRGLLPSADIARDPGMLYVSLGILGATIMPHNLYLHSKLAQTRAASARGIARPRIARLLAIDSGAALTLACLVNAAILIVAGAAFHGGGQAIAGIEDAYKLIDPVLGSGLAAPLFAVALLAAGQSATVTGTMAGQIVAEGFLGLRLNPLLRAVVTRGLALVPAMVIPAFTGGGAIDTLLVASQVVIGVALPFVLVPMVILLRDHNLMRAMPTSPLMLRLAASVTAALMLLNGWLVTQTIA